MILRKDPQAEKYGVIEVDREGRVLGLLGRSFIEGRRFYSVMFSGVQILSADIKRFLPTKGCIIRETLVRLLQSGALVMGYIDSGYWSELGSVAGYYKVVMELLSGQASLRYMDLSSLRDKNLSLKHSEKISLFSPYYIGSGCEIGVGSVIGPSAVLEDGCKIGKDSKVRGSIIWPQVYFRGEIVNKVKSRYAMVAIT
jgi:NDP-sugar pyrophosphorylase family protein